MTIFAIVLAAVLVGLSFHRWVRWIWAIAFGLSTIASVLAAIAYAIHFQILAATGLIVLAVVCANLAYLVYLTYEGK